MKTFREWIDWVNEEVPPEPETIPIPSNHIRLFHYTKGSKHEDAEQLKKNGLDISFSKGSSYGEPNVIWASREVPQHGKIFAEFSVDKLDPRFGPYWRNGNMPREKGDCYFTASILPKEILAVHEPWHGRYRYMVQNNLIDKAKAGEFDFLLKEPDYAPAIIKAKG